jgi:hypothetical protein
MYSKIIATNNQSEKPIVFLKNTIPYTGWLKYKYWWDDVYVLEEYAKDWYDIHRASMSVFLYNDGIYHTKREIKWQFYFDHSDKMTYNTIDFII